MSVQVSLIPQSGERANSPLIFAEINYRSPVRWMNGKCLVQSTRIDTAPQKFRALVFPDVPTAEHAIQKHLDSMRAKQPRLRQFGIEYKHF